jgi:hypothetical protein
MSEILIELHIDELVLHGFAPADRFRIAEALKSELTRLFTEHSRHTTLPLSLAVTQINAGSFKLANGVKPAAIGVQVAQFVHRHVAPIALGRHFNRAVKK